MTLDLTDAGGRLENVIDESQAWFWTSEWQEKEREADADLAVGAVEQYESDDEFLAALHMRTKPLDAGG